MVIRETRELSSPVGRSMAAYRDILADLVAAVVTAIVSPARLGNKARFVK